MLGRRGRVAPGTLAQLHLLQGISQSTTRLDNRRPLALSGTGRCRNQHAPSWKGWICPFDSFPHRLGGCGGTCAEAFHRRRYCQSGRRPKGSKSQRSDRSEKKAHKASDHTPIEDCRDSTFFWRLDCPATIPTLRSAVLVRRILEASCRIPFRSWLRPPRWSWRFPTKYRASLRTHLIDGRPGSRSRSEGLRR